MGKELLGHLRLEAEENYPGFKFCSQDKPLICLSTPTGARRMSTATSYLPRRTRSELD
jgi:hypothetical protein